MTGIEWTWLILTLTFAAFSGWAWHDYNTARVPDEGIGAAVIGFAAAVAAAFCALGWLLALVL